MHIVINGSFWAQPNVGSGQYLHGLVRWLPLVAPEHRYTLLVPASTAHLLPPPPGVALIAVRTPFDRRSKNLAKLWFEQVSVPALVQVLRHPHSAVSARAQIVLHVPYFAPPVRCSAPVITTVGDIIPLRLPEYRGGIAVRTYMALMCHAIRHTAHILTFSAFSRDDVAAYFRIPVERISAILLAADERYRPQDQALAAAQVFECYQLREPFVYYVGGLDVRKNVATLIHACAMLRQHLDMPFTLAIAGRPLSRNQRLFPDLEGLIHRTGTADIVRRIDVPYADGPLLYQACTAFAFPSRYEGFGLPPLEAMACGAPVVVSNASSLPEVVDNAALCVAPDDVAGWSAALRQLLSDEQLRMELRERGWQRAQHFSWRSVAEETVQQYVRVAEQA